jgi:SPP1 family phage portal protein
MYQVDSLEDIDRSYLKDTVSEFANTQRQHYLENLAYADGDNPRIMNRELPDPTGPDNRLPVSYARRIISLVTGYMYKPGLVQYGFEDDAYQSVMQEVFDTNREPIKTAQVGKQTSIHGIGYEYHYVTGDGTTAIPRFTKMPAHEVIPIYSMDLEPEVLAFIRVITRGEEYRLTYVTDRYAQEYVMPKRGGEPAAIGEEIPHYYGECPLAVFQNNEEKLGDFEAVTPLIDAYDVLMSDSMNEFDRFAWAYLLLKGMMLSGEDLQALKQMRVFQNLEDTGDVSFLTKEIDTEFIKFMTDLVRAEIHRQSGIPNLEDYDGAGASGKTMTKFIYLMELFTDPKESYFVEGLRRRLELVNRILTIQGKGGDPMAVDVIMNRNQPDNSLEQADIFQRYAGFVSQKTLLENFADFVDDPDEEIERLAGEGEPNVEVYGNQQGLDVEEPEVE